MFVLQDTPNHYALTGVNKPIEDAGIRPTMSCIIDPGNLLASDLSDPTNPVQEIHIVPTEADILCGRPSSNKHPGNMFFRELVISNVGSYMIARKKSIKSKIVSGILSHLHKIGARFLKWDRKSTQWFIVESSETRMKVSHAVRDRVLEHKNGKEKLPDMKILDSPPSASKKVVNSPIILEMTRKEKPDKTLSKGISKKKIIAKSSFRQRLREISPQTMKNLLTYDDRVICHRCSCGKTPERLSVVPHSTANTVSPTNPFKKINDTPIMLCSNDIDDSLLAPISLDVDQDDIGSFFISQEPEQANELSDANMECNFLEHQHDLMKTTMQQDSDSVLPLLDNAWSSLLSFDDFD